MAFYLNTTVDASISLAERQTHLMVSAVLTVIGAIFFSFGTILRSTTSSTRDNRKCPYCAELVKSEAQLCKHCGRELPPQDVTSSNDTSKQSRFSRRLTVGILAVVVVVVGWQLYRLTIAFGGAREAGKQQSVLIDKFQKQYEDAGKKGN